MSKMVQIDQRSAETCLCGGRHDTNAYHLFNAPFGLRNIDQPLLIDLVLVHLVLVVVIMGGAAELRNRNGSESHRSL